MQGYSEFKLERPMSFEKADPGPAASAQKDFMERIYSLSHGLHRPNPFYDTEYLPVTCSHTFAAVSIGDGEDVRGLHEELSTNDKIDQAKVLQLCPFLEEADGRWHSLHCFQEGVGGGLP